jgi:hypothetical protein
MNIKGIHAPVIENRFGHQMHRVGEGVRSGELTRTEARTLLAQQKGIAQDVYAAKTDDGFLSRGERKDIRAEQRQASKDIFVAKHNAEAR